MSSEWYDFVQKSTNPLLKEWSKQTAPESIIAFHKEVGEFIAQINKNKK